MGLKIPLQWIRHSINSPKVLNLALFHKTLKRMSVYSYFKGFF